MLLAGGICRDYRAPLGSQAQFLAEKAFKMTAEWTPINSRDSLSKQDLPAFKRMEGLSFSNPLYQRHFTNRCGLKKDCPVTRVIEPLKAVTGSKCTRRRLAARTLLT